MLAYVFWHWPQIGIQIKEYELALIRFNDILRKRELDGFVDCFAFRLDSFPWGASSSNGYEDWYLVSDFSSLGILNEGAVLKEAREPHDTVASYAEGGKGGVYTLQGENDSDRAEFATWFTKPRGLSYQDLRANIERSNA